MEYYTAKTPIDWELLNIVVLKQALKLGGTLLLNILLNAEFCTTACWVMAIKNRIIKDFSTILFYFMKYIT